MGSQHLYVLGDAHHNRVVPARCHDDSQDAIALPLTCLAMLYCNHQLMTNAEALLYYLIKCLEVGPAQAGAALAAPHILHLIVTSGQVGHCHLANPAHEDTRVQKLEARFCKVCFSVTPYIVPVCNMQYAVILSIAPTRQVVQQTYVSNKHIKHDQILSGITQNGICLGLIHAL